MAASERTPTRGLLYPVPAFRHFVNDHVDSYVRRHPHADVKFVYKNLLGKYKTLPDSAREVYERKEATETDEFAIHLEAMLQGKKVKRWIAFQRKRAREPSKRESKRSVSSYVLFIKEERAVLKQQHPKATFAELSTMLAAKWQTLDEQERLKYKEKEQEIRQPTEATSMSQEDTSGSDDDEEPSSKKHKPEAKEKATERAKRKEAKALVHPLAPTRPSGAYMLFNADHRKEIVKKHEQVHFRELSGILSQEWQALGDAQKLKYEVLAHCNKQHYRQEKKHFRPWNPADPSVYSPATRSMEDVYSCWCRLMRETLGGATESKSQMDVALKHAWNSFALSEVPNWRECVSLGNVLLPDLALSQWTKRDLTNYLERVGIGQYRTQFLRSTIAGADILQLNERCLQQRYSVHTIGDRKRLLMALSKLVASQSATTEAVKDKLLSFAQTSDADMVGRSQVPAEHVVQQETA